LMKYHSPTFSLVALAFSAISKKPLSNPKDHKSLLLLGFFEFYCFRSLIYFILFIYGGSVTWAILPVLFSVNFYMVRGRDLTSLFTMWKCSYSGHYLLQRLFSSHWIVLVYSSKISWPYMYALTYGLSVLFHWSLWLLLC
jgi:hypothetical protein